MSYRRTNELRPLEVEPSTAGATSHRDLEGGMTSPWQRIKKSDPAAVALANEHYSRRAFGKQGGQLGPPGRLICLATAARDAVWVSHWPYAHLALDGLDAFRCTMFRNTSQYLSSELIRQAREITCAVWGPAPLWLTWIAPELIRSSNPGYCFKMDGWKVDHEWKQRSVKRGVHLLRLWRGDVISAQT